MSERSDPAPVVVGVDGSESGRDALDWAVAEAATRVRPLWIVHACPAPVDSGPLGPVAITRAVHRHLGRPPGGGATRPAHRTRGRGDHPPGVGRSGAGDPRPAGRSDRPGQSWPARRAPCPCRLGRCRGLRTRPVPGGGGPPVARRGLRPVASPGRGRGRRLESLEPGNRLCAARRGAARGRSHGPACLDPAAAGRHRCAQRRLDRVPGCRTSCARSRARAVASAVSHRGHHAQTRLRRPGALASCGVGRGGAAGGRFPRPRLHDRGPVRLSQPGRVARRSLPHRRGPATGSQGRSDPSSVTGAPNAARTIRRLSVAEHEATIIPTRR